MTEPSAIPLNEFWERFARLAPALSRLELPPAINLIHGLNSYFGALVDHSIAEHSGDRLSLMCRNCRNLDEPINHQVCLTHLGVIAGTAGALGVNGLAVEHRPDASTRSCCISLVRRPPDS